jgi:hypothetical protein
MRGTGQALFTLSAEHEESLVAEHPDNGTPPECSVHRIPGL